MPKQKGPLIDGTHIEELTASWQRERSDLAGGDLLLAVYIMRLGRVASDVNDRMCRTKFGINGDEMRVLFALRRAGAPYSRRPTDLFRALLVTSGAITKQVDRLERAKLVQRQYNESDGRGTQIRLTEKGLKVANDAATVVNKTLFAPFLANMPDNLRRSGEQFCKRFLVAWEAWAAAEAANAEPKPPRPVRDQKAGRSKRAIKGAK